MMKKKTKLSDIILPSKKINLFVLTIMILGIISGSIFLITLNTVDKNNTILQIQTFFNNINTNAINNGQVLKNSLIINYVFISIIWILGLSIIGVIFNIFLTYIKGFIVGFSISSIILTYSYKGIIASILYVFPIQVFNLFTVMLVCIYSIMFSKNLLGIVIGKIKNNSKIMFKRYLIILLFAIIISFISSLIEAYILPNLLKIIIELYVK